MGQDFTLGKRNRSRNPDHRRDRAGQDLKRADMSKLRLGGLPTVMIVEIGHEPSYPARRSIKAIEVGGWIEPGLPVDPRHNLGFDLRHATNGRIDTHRDPLESYRKRTYASA
jgi:hypothetical protein